MQGKPEIMPLLLLKGRTAIRREYSKKELTSISKSLRGRNFEKLYVLDVDGIERNKPQLDIVQSLCNDFSISYEAGPRMGANVIDLVVAGADMVYMGTYCLASLDEIEVAMSFTEGIGFKIDWNDGLQGRGKGIKGASLSEVVQGAIRYGAKDIVAPVEIVGKVKGAIGDSGAVLRAMADRPGDEKMTDLDCASLIVNHELLPKEGKPQ